MHLAKYRRLRGGVVVENTGVTNWLIFLPLLHCDLLYRCVCFLCGGGGGPCEKLWAIFDSLTDRVRSRGNILQRAELSPCFVVFLHFL